MTLKSKPITRVLASLALSPLAFLTGAVTEESDAGAHCGGHGNHCGYTTVMAYYFCHPNYGQMVGMCDYYANDCSGTCYNGGTSGCCDSPEACAEAECKPGGCGGACQYLGTGQCTGLLGPC